MQKTAVKILKTQCKIVLNVDGNIKRVTSTENLSLQMKNNIKKE